MTRSLVAALLWLAAFCGGAAPAPQDNESDARQEILVLLYLAPEHFRPDAGYSSGYGGDMGRGARRALASRLARGHGLTLVTDWPMPVLGVDCYVMEIPSGQGPDRTAEKLAQVLSRDARVVWAQPMNVFRTQGSGSDLALGHNDPFYPMQPAARAWRLAELHELATGRGVSVAVVDSGVEQAHPDLAGQVGIAENFIEGHAFAGERHGTAVAGIIGAHADNGIGIAGIAPQATLMALRACWEKSPDETLCTSLSLAKALHFAITHRTAVINVSLSGPQDRLLGQLIDAALSRGITVVAAADPSFPDGGFPASHAGVWAVTDHASTHREQVLLAPGQDTPTTAPGWGWQVVSGASYAAAHVAGLAALLHELGGTRSAVPFHQILVLLASGDIDTCATLMRVAGPRVCSCADAPSHAAAAPATAPGLKQP
jgi:subtilisin family serine protease